MWIFTTGGFVSAVEHREDPDLLMVRARDHRSLECMLDAIELAGNAEEPGVERERPEIVMEVPADYPWRVTVPKATFALWLQFEVLNFLRYDSHFKEALQAERGKDFYKAAMKVWVDMLDVEDTSEHHPKGKLGRSFFEGSSYPLDDSPASEDWAKEYPEFAEWLEGPAADEDYDEGYDYLAERDASSSTRDEDVA